MKTSSRLGIIFITVVTSGALFFQPKDIWWMVLTVWAIGTTAILEKAYISFLVKKSTFNKYYIKAACEMVANKLRYCAEKDPVAVINPVSSFLASSSPEQITVDQAKLIVIFVLEKEYGLNVSELPLDLRLLLAAYNEDYLVISHV